MIFGRMGARFPCARDPQASRSLPLSAAINLHEIHLERQSLLQVPVGHIPVPGGIKLCSPGTFLVANYLIINNGSCQVNFTKPISATIRFTNSQWPCGDGSEVPVAGVPCRRPIRRPLRHARMALRYLWVRSPCQRPVRRPLRHARMALKCLWAGSPCRRPVRSPLRHAGMVLRCLWAGSPCQRPVRRTLCHARMPLRCL